MARRIHSGGWAQAGKLKTQAGSARGVTIQMPAAQEREAAMHTVQIDCPNLPSGAQAVATILFDVEGQATVRRVVSVGNGATLSGNADTVTASVQDDTPAGAAFPAGAEYDIQITIAPEVRPPSSTPPTLYGCVATLIAAGGNLELPIPQQCGAVSAVVVSASALQTAVAQVTVQQTYAQPAADPGVTVLCQYEALRPCGFVPFVGGPDTLKLINNDATNGVLVTVLWGIDG